MTKLEQLAERLEGLAEKATKGPWKIHGGMLGHKGDIFSPTAKMIQDCHHIARFYAPKPEHNPLSDLEAIGATREAIEVIETNATLAAELVNNLPTILAALRAAGEVEKRLGPQWFYHPDYTESCQFSPDDVIDQYDPEPGFHALEVECAVPLPSIWCAVHVRTTVEMDALETDDRIVFTEHASEDDARAALAKLEGRDDG